MPKNLDRKLDAIRSGKYKPNDFIIADAKDGDMAFGCTTPGKGPDGRMKSLRAYRDDMIKVTKSGLVDIMLMSISSQKCPQIAPVKLNGITDMTISGWV